MKHLSSVIFLLLGLLSVFVVQADEDYQQARRLKESGQILPLQQIIKAVEAEYPGRVIEVDLENEDGRHVYEVELLDPQGKVHELYIDASSGKIIKRKRDD